jgi:hypothetical protein
MRYEPDFPEKGSDMSDAPGVEEYPDSPDDVVGQDDDADIDPDFDGDDDSDEDLADDDDEVDEGDDDGPDA